MTLPASLLRELVNPSLSAGSRAKVCCELAREFENRGEYDQACEILSVLWPRIGERPNLEGLDRSIAAEVLLRAGVLTGIVGSNRQIPEAQEHAKNLIGESLALFQAQRLTNKAAEAQIELALCYWRTGVYHNASDLIKLALDQLTDSELKAKAIIRKAIVAIDSDRLPDALQCLTENTSLLHRISSDTLKGCYYQTLGDVFKDLWESQAPGDYLDKALVEYAAASYHFEIADHRRYRANVENNVGMIYFQINQCKEAHAHLDHARRIFTSLKDKGATAQVDENRARVFLKEGRCSEAEKVARVSVRTLEKSGDMHLALIESLTTHGTALARVGNYGAALSTFRRAIDGSQQIGSFTRAGQAALTVFKEMGERLAVQEKRFLISGRTLNEEIHSLEHDLIKHALEAHEGSITRTAKNLGITYQELDYMLKTRHKDLATLRTPVRHRKRDQ